MGFVSSDSLRASCYSIANVSVLEPGRPCLPSSVRRGVFRGRISERIRWAERRAQRWLAF
jgi:hypothetical protein